MGTPAGLPECAAGVPCRQAWPEGPSPPPAPLAAPLSAVGPPAPRREPGAGKQALRQRSPYLLLCRLVCLWADCRAPGAPPRSRMCGEQARSEFSLREKPLQRKGDCLCRGFPHQQSCSTSQLCKQTPRACPKSGFIKLPELSEQRQKSSVKELSDTCSLEAAACEK